jgi:lipopolysaccharide transport system permease protein
MHNHLQALFRHHALVRALVVRHLSSRYRGSVLGYVWSLLNPLFLMAVYSLVFHHLVGVKVGSDANYAVVLFSALLPWIWISSALLEGTSALVASGHLVTKSLFPPQILILVSVLTSAVHYLLALPVLMLFILGAGLPISFTWLLLPLLMGGTILFLYGTALSLGALNVLYRDVQHLVGNALSLLFFLSPIVYSVSLIPEPYRQYLPLNPFALSISLFQGITLNGVMPTLLEWGALFGWGIVTLALGILIFEYHREHIPELL